VPDPADTLVITAVDGQSSVGLNIEDIAAAIRAGVSLFSQHPFYNPIVKDKEVDEPYFLSAALCTQLSDDTFKKERLLELVIEPFIRLIENSALTREQMSRGSICFALPDEDATEDKAANVELALGHGFLDDIIQQVALPDKMDVSAIQLGSIGFFYFLKGAMNKLLSGEFDYVIIVAADSFIFKERLAHFDNNWRLKTDRNPFGFVAGEAASIVMIETELKAKQRGAPVLAKLDSFGLGRENNVITQDKSSAGEGLAVSIEACLTGIRPGSKNFDKPVSWVISDMNGEQYNAYEWGIVNSRLLHYFSGDVVHQHYADVIGEVGSALPGINIGCVINSFEKGYAIDDSALIFSGNDGGFRGALSISKP